MGRFRAASLLLAALAAGLLLAACGSNGNAKLLPRTTADQIYSNLDLVGESANEGNCEGAEDAVAEISTEVEALQEVDVNLKKALKQGAAKLSEVVSTCGAGEEEAEAAQEAKEAEEEKEEELVAAEEAEAEEEAFEEEQKFEEREEKAQEKAEKQAEQPGPPEEGEESTGKGKSNESQEEVVEAPEAEEVTPPTGGAGPAGGIGPGAAVEGEG